MKSLFPTLVALAATFGCGANETAASPLVQETQETEKLEGDTMATRTSSSSKKTQSSTQEFEAIQIEPVRREKPESFENAKEIFEQIRKVFDYTNQPEPLSHPTTREAAYEFAKSMKFLLVQREADIAYLESFSGSDVPCPTENLAEWVENTRKQKTQDLGKITMDQLQRRIDKSRMQIGGQVDGRLPMIQIAAEVDMSDQNKIRNVLCNELLNQSREEAIAVSTDSADIMVLLDDLMGIDSDWSAKRKTLRGTIAKYRENLAAAIDFITPPSDIGDMELTKIAAEVLARKDYDLPEHVRLIVNAPKRSESSTEYILDWSEETITKTPLRWDEFQVATIEKHGERYEIWFNTLIYYHEGLTTVIKEKWLLGPRHMSSPISEANIQK